MKNLVKLFVIALLIVGGVTAAVVFSVPALRNRLLGKDVPEAAGETETAESPEAEGLRELAKMEEEALSSNQVYALAKRLKEREEAIVEQEKRIKRMQEALEEERQDIDRVKSEVQKMHADIAQFIPMIEEGEKKNLKKIARMFETLSVDNANPIMARMPDDTLVVVLSYMKPRNSAKLLGGYAALNAESAHRAALLTEKIKKTVVK
jgi:flagellar motility protein MotE (MotC chaperone)